MLLANGPLRDSLTSTDAADTYAAWPVLRAMPS
jgi:hypothetical protein